MTNPYEAPTESDWQVSPREESSADKKSSQHFLLRLTIFTLTVASSGACFGSVLGLFVGARGVLAGALVGFCIAILPSAVSSAFCLQCVASMFPEMPLKRSNLISGLASGSLAGFVSVMVLASRSLDIESLMFSTVATVFGACGGLCGAYMANRRLKTN